MLSEASIAKLLPLPRLFGTARATCLRRTLLQALAALTALGEEYGRALDLASRKGLLRASDLDALDVPRIVLTRLTVAGSLEKVGRGLYRLPGAPGSEHESLAAVARRVPQAVFCLLTALQFHELTTQLPRQVSIAMPRGSHVPRIEYPPLKMVQMSQEVYPSGVDVALEALKDARARSKASVDDLWRYAKICRVANVMRPYPDSIG